MRNDDVLYYVAAFIAAVAVFLASVNGYNRGDRFVRREAIVKGHAYMTNDAAGEPIFVWKPVPTKSK